MSSVNTPGEGLKTPRLILPFQSQDDWTRCQSAARKPKRKDLCVVSPLVTVELIILYHSRHKLTSLFCTVWSVICRLSESS